MIVCICLYCIHMVETNQKCTYSQLVTLYNIKSNYRVRLLTAKQTKYWKVSDMEGSLQWCSGSFLQSVLYFWRFTIVIIIVKHQFYISPCFDIFWGHFPGCICSVNRSHACIIPDIIITKLIFLCYFIFSILHKETLSLLSFLQYHIHICNLHCKFKLIQIYYIILYYIIFINA